MINQTLYIFVDEGGNLSFKESGTRFYTLTLLSMLRPFNLSSELTDLKYNIWEDGIDFEYFHATEDSYSTREKVFKLINAHIDKFEVDTIIVEKRKTMPHLQNPVYFYQRIFKCLLDYVLTRHGKKFNKIIIVTNSIPIKQQRSDVEKGLKSYLSLWSRMSNNSYRILHYQSKSDLNLQLVDYFNWAIYRKWDGGKNTSFDLIKDAVKNEFEIFAPGKIYYY
jgi:hypothetical protein